MEFKKALGKAIRDMRIEQKFTQESITAFSSRSYLSEVENGKNEASLTKINEIASLINVHPLSILMLAYLNEAEGVGYDELQRSVNNELSKLKKMYQSK